MKTPNDPVKNMINQLWRVSHKYSELEKTPVRYNEKIELPPGEIHSIQTIGKNKGINIKELGEHFGISKSAASQMVSRLLRKGYVVKSNPADNNKELQLSLTAKGWEAFSLHETFHARHQETLSALLRDNFSDTDLARTEKTLRLIETFIDDCKKSLNLT